MIEFLRKLFGIKDTRVLKSVDYSFIVYEKRIDGKWVEHNEDGPAISTRYMLAWYKNGNKHREDGPAVIWGDCSRDYYLNGIKVEKESLAEYKIRNTKLGKILYG